MIHLVVGANASGGGYKYALAGGGVSDERGIEIVDGQEGVEGSLGHGAFGSSTGGAGGFAGEAGNEIHEQLGQFHVVNRRKTAERRNALFAIGAVVAAAGQNTSNGVQHGIFRR